MSPETISLLVNALWETVYMVGVSAFLASLVGIPLGVVLVITDKNQFYESILKQLRHLHNGKHRTDFVLNCLLSKKPKWHHPRHIKFLDYSFFIGNTKVIVVPKVSLFFAVIFQ